MKSKTNTLKRIFFFSIAAVFVLAVCGVLSIGIPGVVFGMAAAGVAASPVGTQEVNAASPQLNLDTILQEVTEISPSKTPLDQIMRYAGRSIGANSWKVDNYSVVDRPIQDTVKTTYTTQAGIKSANISVTNPSQWTVDHTVMVQGTRQVFLVTGVDYTNGTIAICSINNGTSQPDVPTISAGTSLSRMGMALGEKQANTDAYAEIPTPDFNYCQKFGAKLEETFVQQIQNQQVKWGFSDIQRMRIKAMRTEMEASYIFGQRGCTLRTSNGKQEMVYTMNGITNCDIKELTYGTGGNDRTFNSDTMSGLMKDIFTGNSGETKRFAFYGSDMGRYLYGVTDWTKIIKDTQTEIVPGLTFTKYLHNYGELELIYHPLFDSFGMSEAMLVVDATNLVKSSMFPLKIVDLELEKTGLEDANAKMLKETSTLLTLYPETHALILPHA